MIELLLKHKETGKIAYLYIPRMSNYDKWQDALWYEGLIILRVRYNMGKKRQAYWITK